MLVIRSRRSWENSSACSYFHVTWNGTYTAEAPIESIGMMSLLKELPTMSSLCGSTRSVRHNDRHAALLLSATIST